MAGVERALDSLVVAYRRVAQAWYTWGMQQEMPVHGAPHDRSFFQVINFYIAIGVVIFGVWTGEIFLATLGLLVGLIYWFTTPRFYYILSDRLVVMYGQPRTLVVPFESIFDVNIVRVPLTAGIFVRRVNKAGVIIRPREMEGFVGQLWTAMSAAGAPAAENMLAQQTLEAEADDDNPAGEPSPEGTLPPDEDIRAADNEPEADGPPPGR